jgi:hypothetical protein
LLDACHFTVLTVAASPVQLPLTAAPFHFGSAWADAEKTVLMRITTREITIAALLRFAFMLVISSLTVGLLKNKKTPGADRVKIGQPCSCMRLRASQTPGWRTFGDPVVVVVIWTPHADFRNTCPPGAIFARCRGNWL